ncbi:LysR family transcriptional regulator, partial [Vibrio alfacsensis]
MANEQTLLRNLHTFHVAAKVLSFTLAAKELHLTQGAVSHRIKVLEKSLGFNLFTRGTRKLGLTE